MVTSIETERAIVWCMRLPLSCLIPYEKCVYMFGTTETRANNNLFSSQWCYRIFYALHTNSPINLLHKLCSLYSVHTDFSLSLSHVIGWQAEILFFSFIFKPILMYQLLMCALHSTCLKLLREKKKIERLNWTDIYMDRVLIHLNRSHFDGVTEGGEKIRKLIQRLLAN